VRAAAPPRRRTVEWATSHERAASRPAERRWVIVSADRAARPADFELLHEYRVGKKDCPSAPGARGDAREIYAMREGGGGPNDPAGVSGSSRTRYPALAIEGSPTPGGRPYDGCTASARTR